MSLFCDTLGSHAVDRTRFVVSGPPQQCVRRHSHTGTPRNTIAERHQRHQTPPSSKTASVLVSGSSRSDTITSPLSSSVSAQPNTSSPLPQDAFEIKAVLKSLDHSLHTRLEFPVDSWDVFETLIELVDGDPTLQQWSVEYYGGKIVTLLRPGHEVLDSFWRKVSWSMEAAGWLTPQDIDNLHVHQANIEMEDGSELRPDLCILPDRDDHYPTIVFETTLSQTYENTVEKAKLWFTGSMGRIEFVVIINFKFPRRVLTNKSCTVELWRNSDKDSGFLPVLAYGPKNIYPEPEYTVLEDPEEDIVLQFTYGEFFGVDGIPDVYVPVKDRPFVWSMKSLRFAVDLALRSRQKAEAFRAKKRKRAQDSDNTLVSGVPEGRAYRQLRCDDNTDVTDKDLSVSSTEQYTGPSLDDGPQS